jgi:hypothetical protein
LRERIKVLLERNRVHCVRRNIVYLKNIAYLEINTVIAEEIRLMRKEEKLFMRKKLLFMLTKIFLSVTKYCEWEDKYFYEEYFLRK